MIPQINPLFQPVTRRSPPRWQQEWSAAIRSSTELLALLGLSAHPLAGGTDPAPVFPVRVPHSFAARMRRGDWRDPLLRQVLPLNAENQLVAGFHTDPVGDLTAEASPGVLHKYHGRALLITTGSCAVHCRYCFRRHYPYQESSANSHDWQAALDYLRQRTEITEVILSGGDPLSLSDDKLAGLVDQLQCIPHLTRLRIHTRVPVVIPSRVNDELLDWLRGTRLNKVIVLHINHANEIDADVRSACALLRRAGATLLNQSVLLNGVNDDDAALAGLSEALFAAGVLPYYLHMLDPVQGAAHFSVAESTARELMAGLRQRLPGYLVPKLAREIAGETAKRVLL